MATVRTSVAKRAFDKSSFITSATNPPMMAVGIPARPTMAAVRPSMFFARALRHVPMMAVGMMTAADVPLAITGMALKNTIMIGTITTPPPIPRRPARTPVRNPMMTRAIALPTSIAPRPSASVGTYRRIAVSISIAVKR
ncbi:MAG: hypothetical protein EBS22_06250 [Acidimicrobiia bacterium]|nr:hypothetical protein [Acidimicrobiia bacterium]